MRMIIQTIVHIFRDFLQPITYLPLGILAGGIFLTGWGLRQKRQPARERIRITQRQWLTCLIIVYVTVLLILAFFSREPGSRTGVDLIPLSTWGTSAQAHAYFIENILMFIPFGILLPFRVPALRRALFCIDAGFLCSLLLETAQLLTGRGYCQLDDIATNTLGTGLGYLIYRLWQRYGRKR